MVEMKLMCLFGLGEIVLLLFAVESDEEIKNKQVNVGQSSSYIPLKTSSK